MIPAGHFDLRQGMKETQNDNSRKAIRNAKRHFWPGPYTLCKDKDGCDDVWQIYAANEERPFVTLPYWGCDSKWTTEATATARLLAAAPELFEALEHADTCLDLVAGSKYRNSELGREIRQVMSRVLTHSDAQ